MKRLNQYLLVHHPLLWNTRVVWVLLANLLLHLFFFLGGLGSVTVKTLVKYYDISRVGGESLFIFSVLCSLLVVIVWCIFYLRNNAFKSFYRLSKFYLTKEFGIIFLILLTTISYPQSYQWGVKLRVRSITDERALAYEITEVNKGMVYVPILKPSYFILNSCEDKESRNPTGDALISPPEPGQYYGGADSVLVKEALQKPNAFSYANYCSLTLYSAIAVTEGSVAIDSRNKRWLFAGHRDSVKQSIAALFAVLNKYGVDYRLNADGLTAAVFTDSLFTLGALIPAARFNYQYGERENKSYLNQNDLEGLFRLIEDCQPGADNWRDVSDTWTVIGYIAISLSVLLLCYRRFSRKVFLISVVGSLVWMILIGLIGIGNYESKNSIPSLLLFLCTVFLLVALAMLTGRRSKTVAGVTLNWHVYLVPFALMLMVALVHNYHQAAASQYYGRMGINVDALMRQRYPFSTWVVKHEADIFLANILVVACYVAFVFNGLAKRWYLLPEE